MEGLRFGRFPITAVQPAVEGGKFPAKAVVGETLVVGATSFREGHDRLGVSAVLLDPRGKERQRVRLATPRGPRGQGTDRWEGLLTPSGTGNWSFVIEAWHDSYGTWHHNAEVKVEAGIDVELMLAEGAALLAVAAEDSSRPSADRRTLRMAVVGLNDTGKTAEERLAAGFSHEVADVIGRQPIREQVTVSEAYPLLVE
ncbi:MAG TPA: maltotransferase domain-containing protein, partial [Arthrobacter sp.]|nr:maltotransferase domain-containing protein [Arthrobacter sp.]